jgi:predicted RNA-binding Zn-ribbon protein involved in translation (DUF1610 family)
MLSVGRELFIRDQPVICLECGWQGFGSELATGPLQAQTVRAYVYAYRCALCGSFEVRRQAKILKFRQPAKSEQPKEPQRLTRKRI